MVQHLGFAQEAKSHDADDAVLVEACDNYANCEDDDAADDDYDGDGHDANDEDMLDDDDDDDDIDDDDDDDVDDDRDDAAHAVDCG